jgi:hypothetical protein
LPVYFSPLSKMNKYPILLIFLLASLCGVSQDLQTIEKDLLKHLKKINRLSEDRPDGYDTQLEKENETFKTKLLKYTSLYPATINYAFKYLKDENLRIAESADHKFRIYSWNTWMGGSMPYYENICQAKTGTIYAATLPESKEWGSAGWFSEIFTLNTPERTVYIGYLNAAFSSKDVYQAVKLFSIENNTLNDTLRLIRTGTGLHNTLGFEFDFFSVVDREERPVKLIFFDEAQQALRIPVVNGEGKVTSRFITYRFNGTCFEKVKK